MVRRIETYTLVVEPLLTSLAVRLTSTFKEETPMEFFRPTLELARDHTSLSSTFNHFHRGSLSDLIFAVNGDHQPAAAYNAKYPYNGAKNGVPGKGQGGYQVPAAGDDAHKYVAPGKNDIRGP
jgi:hypothetical protein